MLALAIEQPAQNLQGTGAAINQVADQPQPVMRRLKPDLFQQPLERMKATLDIAYCISGHRRAGLIGNYWESGSGGVNLAPAEFAMKATAWAISASLRSGLPPRAGIMRIPLMA